MRKATSESCLISLSVSCDIRPSELNRFDPSGAAALRDELRKDLRAEQVDAATLVEAVRRAELDPRHTRVEEPPRLFDDLRGSAGVGEAVERLVGNEPAGAL